MNEADDGGYNDEMADAGIDAGEYSEAPKWEQRRIDKIAGQKKKFEAEASAANERNAVLEGRLQAMEAQMVNFQQAPNAREPEATGLDRFKSTEELKKVARQLYEYQALANNPDATPEARAAARTELSRVDDVPGTLADINERIADLRVEDKLGQYRQEREQHDANLARQGALAASLLSEYGQPALQKDSELSKAAASQIQSWINSGEVTADNAGQDFVVKQAFKQATQALTADRGGRGSDPRHSAIEGGGASRAPADNNLIASLKARGEQGDYRASRKASQIELDDYLKVLSERGAIG